MASAPMMGISLPFEMQVHSPDDDRSYRSNLAPMAVTKPKYSPDNDRFCPSNAVQESANGQLEHVPMLCGTKPAPREPPTSSAKRSWR